MPSQWWSTSAVFTPDNNKKSERSMSRSIGSFWKVCLFLLCVVSTHTTITSGQYFEEDLQSCSPDKVNYEWERLNYYEILGFSSSELKKVSKIENKAIRKAYRNQAQIWHPDKIKANETLTIDEINARFARVAEAYQTLNDPLKRQAYDQFLKNCHYTQDQGGSANGRQGGNGRGHTSYQERRSNYQSNGYNNRQQYQASQQQAYYHQQGFQQRRDPPSSERKTRDMLVDPMTGAPILRETTYQEYRDDNYYRIYVEDYLVESMDAWGNTYYRPLNPYPQIAEEGQLYADERPTDTLQSGNVLRMNEFLLSDNERYRARLDGCQLVIETGGFTSGAAIDYDVDIVWQSNNAVPNSTTKCFLGFARGQLFIAGGSPESYSRQVYWQSTINDNNTNEDDDIYYGTEYIARLENDGKLVVYKLDAFSSVGGASENAAVSGKCIYATGPGGCNRIASKISAYVRDAKEYVSSYFQTEGESESESESDDWKFQQKNLYENYYEEDNEEEIYEKLLREAKHVLEMARDSFPETIRDIKMFLSSIFESLAEAANSQEQTFDYKRRNNHGGPLFLQKLPPKVQVALRRINRKRKIIEEFLDRRTFEFVQDVHLRWKRRSLER